MDGSISYFNVLFVRCGVIGWVLWGMSVLTLGLIIKCLITIRPGALSPTAFYGKVKALLSGRQYQEAMDLAGKDGGLAGVVLHSALRESSRGYPAMERAMEDACERHCLKLCRQIEWLNLIGNIAPMMGLLGTVWGMILAFFTIVDKGGVATPSDLAGAIGIKLVCTLEGLMVAIPALAVYGFLRNRIESFSAEAMVRCQELISAFHPGRKPHLAIPVATEEKVAATGT